MTRTPAGLPTRDVLDRRYLTDPTRCPVCSGWLAGPRCASCGVDLAGAAGARAWDLSTRIASLLIERDGVLRDLLDGAARSRTAPVAPAPSGPSDAASSGWRPQSTPSRAPSGGGGNPPTARPPGEAARRPSRFGAQGLLVALGALLLAVAAVVFLAFSWELLSLGGRALVIGGFTIAALAAAARLRPRLAATAEAIGSIGVVLVLADAWAVRRTGLLGADRPEGFAYAAAATGVAAVLLGGWALASRVRATSIAAVVLAPASALLTGMAVSQQTEQPRDVALGALAAALVAAGRVRTPSSWDAERVLLRIAASLYLLTALSWIMPMFGKGQYATATALLLVSAAVTVAQVRADQGGPAVLASAWSVVAAAFAVAAAVPAGVGLPDGVDLDLAWALGLAPVLAGLVVLGLARVPGTGRVGFDASSGLRAGLVTAGTTAIPAGAVAVFAALRAAGLGLDTWTQQAWTPLGRFVRETAEAPSLGSGPSVVEHLASLVGLAALAAVAVTVSKQRPVDREPVRVLACGVVVVAVICAPLSPRLPIAAVVALLALVAVAAGAAMVRYVTSPMVSWSATATAAGAGLLGILLAWSVPELSVPATLLGVGGLLLARRRVPADLRPVLQVLVVLSVGVAAGAVAGLLGRSVADRLTVAGCLGAVLAAMLLAVPSGLVAVPAAPVGPDVPRAQSARESRRAVWRADERRAGSAIGAGLSGVALGAALLGGGGARSAEPGRLALVLGFLLLTAVAATFAAEVTQVVGRRWATVREAVPAGRAASVLGAGAVPPLVAGFAPAVALILDDRGGHGAAVLVAAGALAAAGVILALLGLRSGSAGDPRRLAAEVGAVTAGCVVLLAGFATTWPSDAEWRPGSTGRLWIVLLLLGVGVTAVASAPDRRQYGWGGGVLLTASTWLRLSIGAVDVVEAYTVPPAIALLVVAAVRLRRGAGTQAWRVVVSGSALALTPSILASATGGSLRPRLLLAVGAALVVAALWLSGRGRRKARPLGLVRSLGPAVVVAGGLIGAGVGLLRPFAGLVHDRSGLADIEQWSVPGALLVLVGAAVLARLRGWLLVPGMTVAAVPSLAAALVTGASGRAEVVLVVTGLTAIAAAGVSSTRPLTLLTWSTATGARALAIVAALTVWVCDDTAVEAWSLPLACCLITVGAFRMVSRSAVHSWPALGPGLCVALLPTLLLAVQGQGWRIGGLTLVAAGVVLAGVRLRLKAPAVLGGAVLGVHGLIQLAPYLADVTAATPRWLMLALVGAILLALGATYERRIQQLRAVGLAIAALR